MIEAKRKAFIFLLLAFVLAVVASGLIINEIRKAQAAIGETVEVAVAENDIKSYTEIDEDDIKWKKVPKTDQSSAFIQNKNDLEDKIVLVNIEENQFITKNILRKKISIPVDHRVVWLNATKNVVSDQDIKVGDLVDIFVTYKKDEKLVTERLLESVEVVQKDDARKTERGIPGYKVALSVEDAKKLIYYQNTAKQIRVIRVNQIPEEKTKKDTQSSGEEDTKTEQKNKQKKQESSESDKSDKKNDKKESDKKQKDSDKKKNDKE